MQHERFVAAIGSQCEALRSAAVEAGPAADVPTCPGWTVHKLIAHLGRVHSWVVSAIQNPSGENVKPERPPEDWNSLLAWWDQLRAALVDLLADPDAPTWLPFSQYPQVTASWARRQAHETAIHRLDAEHARAGSADPNAVPSLVFDSEFAADGISELTGFVLPGAKNWAESAASGTVLLHAADAGRVWTVRLEPGRAPVVQERGFEGDLTIAGTADAVYRRLWGRPSHAAISGDTALLAALASP